MTAPTQLRRGPLNSLASIYLKSWGVNPQNVSTVGHDFLGYTYLSSARYGERVPSLKKWPPGFNYAEFIRLSWEENDE